MSDVAPVATWRRALVDDCALSSSEKLVALVLHDYWNANGTCPPFGHVKAPGAGPSIATLVVQTRLSRSTVIRALDGLERAGTIKVTHRSRGGHGSNRYVMGGAKIQRAPRKRKGGAASELAGLG